MPKKIALDLSGNVPRAIIAMVNAGAVKVLSVHEIAASDTPTTSRGAMADAVKAWVAENKLSGTDTIVLAGRKDIEVRTLELPPVADAELPDMVRLQAIRKLSGASDRSPVDFLLLNRHAEGVEVLAAAISPEAISRIRNEIQTSDLTLQSVTLRSIAMAAMTQAIHAKDSGNRETLARIDDETELTTFRDGKLANIRTVRTPASLQPDGLAKVLAGEIKRTRLATAGAEDSDAEPATTTVDWWGDQAIGQALSAEMNQPVQTRSIEEAVTVASGVVMPADRGSLAPMIGALLADSGGGHSIVDFVNPRKRPEVKPNRIKTIAIAAAPILVLAGIGYGIQSKLSGMDEDIRILGEQLETMKPSLETANQSMAETESIDDFLDGDVLWLDEVKRLAERMPPSDQMIVTQLKGSLPSRGGGGNLEVTGGVTNPNVLDRFAAGLRDESHRVVGDGASETESKDAYRWTFTETIVIDPDAVRLARYERLEALADEEIDESPNQPDGSLEPDEQPEPDEQAAAPTTDDEAKATEVPS